MPILGTLLKKGIKIRKIIEQERIDATELQQMELQKLLLKASKKSDKQLEQALKNILNEE